MVLAENKNTLVCLENRLSLLGYVNKSWHGSCKGEDFKKVVKTT